MTKFSGLIFSVSLEDTPPRFLQVGSYSNEICLPYIKTRKMRTISSSGGTVGPWVCITLTSGHRLSTSGTKRIGTRQRSIEEPLRTSNSRSIEESSSSSHSTPTDKICSRGRLRGKLQTTLTLLRFTYNPEMRHGKMVFTAELSSSRSRLVREGAYMLIEDQSV